MKREKYEKRLFRILQNAGYNICDISKLSIEDILEIDEITVPNIRSIVFIQTKLKEGDFNGHKNKSKLQNNINCKNFI